MKFAEPPPADPVISASKIKDFFATITAPWRHWFNLIHLYLVQMSNPWHVYGGFQDEDETLAVADDTWTKITNATTDLWTGLELVGFTLATDVLTVTNAGDYFGKLSITFSALNGKDYQIRCRNTTQGVTAGYDVGATTTGATNFTNVSLPLYIEDAAAGDTFEIQIKCTTDGTDPILRSAVFYIAYLHD
jgi:hypothetical protein